MLANQEQTDKHDPFLFLLVRQVFSGHYYLSAYSLLSGFTFEAPLDFKCKLLSLGRDSEVASSLIQAQSETTDLWPWLCSW